MKIGIVGHGFVGKAVDYGFEHPLVEKFFVDPIYNTTIDDLIKWQPQVVFICAPTPMAEDGSVDASIVKDAVTKLLETELVKPLILIKSTITPDVIVELTTPHVALHNVVYNPEFLTERSSQEQFINPPFHIFGGAKDTTKMVSALYRDYSNCNACDEFHMSAVEASFVKYTINTFLATKVTFFNELYDVITAFGGNFNVVTRAVGADPRIGTGHTKVPGFDMKRGFGGACFPKDTKAFTEFAQVHIQELSLLEKVVEINNKYRSQYEKDEREKAQNVNYDV